ncbi:MAG: hypothetical protein LH702_20825 [Phormidesmis sp. CAN_BIN44]|nr:hypothetical protein [Phormidesmis sp. CAN_BIN44]
MYAAQIKELIEAEHLKTGNAWIELSRLSQLLYDRHQVTVTKNFFIENTEFRTYGTPNPNEIYISLPIEISLLTAAKRPVFPVNKTSSQNRSKLQILSTFESCEELEEELYQILHHLTYKYPDTFVDIRTMESYFHNTYGTSIQSIVNELIPDLKSVEFLQCSNRFLVVQAESFWKVAIAPPLQHLNHH